MKEKFMMFMRGRYGTDELSKFLLIAGLGLVLLANLTGSTILYLMSTAVIVFSYYRIFSKDTYRCSLQNQKYLGVRNRLIREWKSRVDIFRQRKDYRIYSCPSCNQKVRIPKGKGKVEITCPKCATKFSKRS
jgi:predicted RNA-binding Zn-ribbon protein involved in translation (DUF1610 family)